MKTTDNTQRLNAYSDYALIVNIVGEAAAVKLKDAVFSRSLHEVVTPEYSTLKGRGLTDRQALALISALELASRLQADKVKGQQITCSSDVFQHLNFISGINHEEFWVLYLRRNNTVIAKERISEGGMAGTVTDVRIILRKALEYRACGLILAHNHPSGNGNPSEADRKITDKIKGAAALMDLQVLDHVILTSDPDTYFSFADNGLI